MTRPSLTAPFANTQQLEKGGRKFTFVPTPEAIERLNACLGYGGWSFEIVNAFHFPADDPQYVTVHGRLRVLGQVYEQFGGQTPNRNKAGVILDLADDYKGAASDALKKCAAYIGLGLYLSLKRNPTPFSQSADLPPAEPEEITPSGDDGRASQVHPPPVSAPVVESSTGSTHDEGHAASSQVVPPAAPGGVTGGESREAASPSDDREALAAHIETLPLKQKALAKGEKARLKITDWSTASDEQLRDLRSFVAQLEVPA